MEDNGSAMQRDTRVRGHGAFEKPEFFTAWSRGGRLERGKPRSRRRWHGDPR